MTFQFFKLTLFYHLKNIINRKNNLFIKKKFFTSAIFSPLPKIFANGYTIHLIKICMIQVYILKYYFKSYLIYK